MAPLTEEVTMLRLTQVLTDDLSDPCSHTRWTAGMISTDVVCWPACSLATFENNFYLREHNHTSTVAVSTRGLE